MSKVRRIYVEKKADFAVRAGELKEEISSYIGLNDIEAVRVLIRYDVENVTDATYEKAKTIVFSEPPVDDLYEEKFPVEVGEKAFSVEYLPGQFDQRADSAAQCVKLLNETEEPVIKSATTYVIKGSISDAELKKIEEYVVNPVDSRVASEDKPETLVDTYPEPSDVAVLDGFISMDSLEFKKLYTSLNLAMSYADFLFIKDYFKNDEKRDPSMTEIRMLDTYWSDHCRHTTFLTELKDVKIDDGEYAEPIRASFEKYKEAHRKLSEGKSGKYISLMDIALAGMKELRREGKLTDMEDTDEINACSIKPLMQGSVYGGQYVQPGKSMAQKPPVRPKQSSSSRVTRDGASACHRQMYSAMLHRWSGHQLGEKVPVRTLSTSPHSSNALGTMAATRTSQRLPPCQESSAGRLR